MNKIKLPSRLAVSVAVAGALLSGYGSRKSYAGTCIEVVSGSWTCSGAAVGGEGKVDFSKTGAITVTNDGTFGLDVRGADATGVNFVSSGPVGDLNVNLGSANITSDRGGVRVDNGGSTGNTVFNSTGTLHSGSAGGLGVLVGIFNAANSDDVYASVNNVTHTTPDRAAFQLIHYGAGAITAITQSGGVIDGSATRNGIEAHNRATGTDITITVNGDVSGGGNAIYALNKADDSLGATTITTHGVVIGGGVIYNGIWVNNEGSKTTALEVEANGDVTGASGINTRNSGIGATVITTNGNVVGTSSMGIFSYNQAAGEATDITITTNGNVTGVTYGILAYNNSTATGVTTVTTDSGTTVQSDSFGIYASNASINKTDLRVEALGTVTGSGNNGITAANSGTGLTTVITGEGQITGGANYDGILAINTLSGSALVVTTGTGAVSGGQDGIDAQNSSEDGLIITAAGDVTGQSGHGINATNLAGSLAVNTLGTTTSTDQDGIHATNLNGTSTSTLTINNATGGNNGIFASNNTSALQSLTVTGAVTGGRGSGIATLTGLGGTTNVTLDSEATISSTSGVAITNDAGDSAVLVQKGAVVTGDISLGEGSDVLSFMGSDFSAVTLFDGGDDNDATDGFVDTLAFVGSSGSLLGATVNNWENVNIGRGSVISFSDNMLTVGSSAGTGLTNQGTLSLQNGQAGDKFVLTGNYTGSGGVLAVDTTLGEGISATDKLIISGDTSGTTLLNINNIGGTGALTGSGSTDGIKVVEVEGNSAGTFAVANGGVISGAYLYDLNQADGQNWYLQSIFLPQIEGYRTLATVFGHSIDSLRQRLGMLGPSYYTGQGSYAWARVVGGKREVDSENYANFTENKYFLQAGFSQEINRGYNGIWLLGINGLAGNSSVSIGNADGDNRSIIDNDFYGLGLSAIWFGNKGFYADLVAQYTEHSAKFISTRSSSTIDGDNLAFSVELGKQYRPWLRHKNLSLVPQIQLTASKANFDSFTDDDGVVVSVDNGRSLTGRIGLMLEKTRVPRENLVGFVGVNVHFNLAGSSSIKASGEILDYEQQSSWLELAAGGSYKLGPNTDLYGQLNASTSLDSSVDSKSIRGELGLRTRW